MDKKYLLPMKDGFLVYQPESDTVYRGKRKTLGLNFAFTVPFVVAIITPFFDLISSYVWPIFYFHNNMLLKYNLLMIIFGYIYYKYVYSRNKSKLLNTQLVEMELIDVKEQFFKTLCEKNILAVLFVIFIFLIALYYLVNIEDLGKENIFLTALVYWTAIPVFVIEFELKGNFLLIKRLSKLK